MRPDPQDVAARLAVEGDNAAPRPTIGQPGARRNADPRGFWMRQNLHCKPFDGGRFQGRPMHSLRIATMVANARH